MAKPQKFGPKAGAQDAMAETLEAVALVAMPIGATAQTSIEDIGGASRESEAARTGELGEPGLARGTAVGRYVILDVIGAGGMSVVYAAYDPDLERKVALKVLRPSHRSGEHGGARLLREAQTMAKLSHPNVTTVFEVGTVGERVFVAMEYVAGQHLREWLHARPRRLPEIVDAFVQAGRGLSAAHAHGIVHRDFKPENVILGEDGNVRVTDFGIARIVNDPGGATPDDLVSAGVTVTTSERYETQLGSIVGTPAYMAPEQYYGALDQRTDQFSFCVAFHEALYGLRPFAGRTVSELRAAILGGQIVARPDTHVPRWLHAILLRGLRLRPEERFGSMTELLAQLERRRGARRRGWIAGVAAIAIASSIAYGLAARTTARANVVCEAASRRWDGVWDPVRRRELESAFRTTGPGGEALWRRVEKTLDAYVAAVNAMSIDACEATHVRGEQSEALLDVRMACLDQRRADVEALTGLLSEADAETTVNAARAAHGLAPVDTCSAANARRGQRASPRDAQTREAVAKVEAQLSRARAAFGLGAYREALAEAERAVARARALGDSPTLAGALRELGLARWRSGELEPASLALVEAAATAEVARADRLRVETLSDLVYVDGLERQRLESARNWEKLAAATIHVLDDDALLAGRLAANYANALLVHGDLDGAYAQVKRAGTLLARVLPPDHPELARNLNDLGSVLFYLGRYDEARPAYERALALRIESLGPDHPDVSESKNNLANLLAGTGDAERAFTLYEEALEGWRRSLGPDHAHVATTLSNLGVLLLQDDRPEEALARFTAALELERSGRGPHHPHVALSLNQIGTAHEQAGEHAAAIRAFREALSVLEGSETPDHPYVGLALTNLGLAQLAAGQTADAIATLETVLRRRSSSLGADRNALQPCRNGRCDVSQTRFALARALEAARPRLPRALDLAREAARDFADAGEGWDTQAAEVEAWLESRAPSRGR